MILTHDDLQEILALLDASDFEEAEIETPRFKLTLRRAGGGWTRETETRREGAAQSATPAAAKRVEEALAPGMAAISAPLIGTFYRAPKPGADPFVTVGSTVGKDTVIGIIETMKLMNSVPAGVAGVIVEIVAENAEFVEHGRMLMKVRLR